MPYDPDFELCDNAGRTTEQINSYNHNTPTRDDLRRWSVKGPLPEPIGPAITAWTDRLASADRSEIAQLIVLSVSDTNGVLPRLHQFLETAEDKLREAGADEAAADLSSVVTRLGELDQDLYYMATDAWNDIYDDQHRTNAATSTSPAADARPLPAAPAPDQQPAPPPAPPHADNPRTR
jgi:hypothetical protein